MKTTNKIICLALPLILLGCQTLSPGGTTSSPLSMGNGNSTVSLAARPQAAVEIPPTADTTLTAPEAKGAMISAQPIAQAEQPAQFGGLTLSVRWPQQPEAVRRTQVIPTSANSLWVKVYSGAAGGTATGSAAPEGTILASRVVGRGISDQVPGASPTPCCQQQGDDRSTVYMSLPPGSVTVWVGTFAEGPTEVSTSSVFLSSAQKAFNILANKLTTGASLNLAGNPAIAPSVSAVSPAYMGPNGTVTIQGTNFGTDPEAVKVNLYQPSIGCSTCPPNLVAMTVNSVSSSSITATVPANAYGTHQIQVEAGGFKTVGGSIGILDKNNGLHFTLDSVRQYYVTNEPQKWATAKGARVTVKKLLGYVQCCSDPINMPLTGVTVMLPGGATTSLDASGSFVASDSGAYGLTANFGDAKGNESVSAFNVVAAFNTSRDYPSANNTHKDLGLDLSLVKPDCDTCQPSQSFSSGIAPSLFYGFKSVYLVDESNKKVLDLVSTDFTVTGSAGLTLDPVTQLLSLAAGAQPGEATVSASLDMNPSYTYQATVNVLPIQGAVVRYQWGSNNYWNVGGSWEFMSRLTYYEVTEDRTYEVGQDTDFRWAVIPVTEGASASIDSNGYLSAIATGTVTIQAELKKRASVKGTMNIVIQ